MRSPPLIADPQLLQRPSLATAYEECRKITRHHARTFYLSAHLLPRHKRADMLALYAFCRLTDDLVDRPLRDAASALYKWRCLSRRDAEDQDHPVLLAWATIRERYAIPQHLAEELMDGCMQDLTTNRYHSYAEVEHYCYLVASTVGLMSMRIIGFSGPEAEPYAVKLGIALQLTNILRDIGEDAACGRIYLPLDELRQFGYSEEDLLSARVTPAFKRLMNFQIERAHALYEEGLRGIPMLAADGRFAIMAAAQLYRKILACIPANGYDVFTRRAHTSLAGKLMGLPGIWRQSRRMDRGATQ